MMGLATKGDVKASLNETGKVDDRLRRLERKFEALRESLYTDGEWELLRPSEGFYDLYRYQFLASGDPSISSRLPQLEKWIEKQDAREAEGEVHIQNLMAEANALRPEFV